MSFESNPNQPSTETSALAEVSPQTSAIVETELAHEPDDVRQETQALIEAIKQRAQQEAQTAEDLAKSAGDFTRETYLKLVRQAREAVEQNRLIDPDEIQRSAQQLQADAEKNWEALVKEVTDLSDRLSEAAKAAWEKLVTPTK